MRVPLPHGRGSVVYREHEKSILRRARQRAFRICALAVAASSVAFTVEPEVQELFEKARQKVIENSLRLPRYTCVETISRAQFAPRRSSPSTCQALIAMRREGQSPGTLVARDRFRVEVAVINGGEMFSWAGAGKFETHDVDKLLGAGASGSGDFGSFLAAVFGNAPDAIGYLGLRKSLAVFEYNVPQGKSSYRYHSGSGPDKTIGFRGTFSIDPADAELQQLVVATDQFDPSDSACRVEHVMDYQHVKIGKSDSLLPEVSTMRALYRNGGESVNETRYSDCREYVGESTIHFDDVDSGAPAVPGQAARSPVPAIPSKVRLQIGLAKPVNTEIAAAGDEVTGVLLEDVKDKKAGAIAHQGDVVHGRILRLKQTFYPTQRWTIAIRFESIERNGFMQPLSLKALDNRGPSPFPELSSDTGVFTFDARGSLTLDQKFHSVWETR